MTVWRKSSKGLAPDLMRASEVYSAAETTVGAAELQQHASIHDRTFRVWGRQRPFTLLRGGLSELRGHQSCR